MKWFKQRRRRSAGLKVGGIEVGEEFIRGKGLQRTWGIGGCLQRSSECKSVGDGKFEEVGGVTGVGGEGNRGGDSEKIWSPYMNFFSNTRSYA